MLGEEIAFLSLGLEGYDCVVSPTHRKQFQTMAMGKNSSLNLRPYLGEVKLLNKVFNRGPFPIGGNTDTPFQTAIKPNDPFDFKLCGPHFVKFLVCGDWDESSPNLSHRTIRSHWECKL